MRELTNTAKKINRFPKGTITPPASKSLMHRAVICAAISGGNSIIHNVSLSDDINATVEGAGILGAEFKLEGTSLYVKGGPPRQKLLPQGGLINCKESGSTLRFLIPVAALWDRETVFKGEGRLLIRPMDVYDAVFEDSGVSFSHTSERIKVRGPLQSGVYTLPGNVSSQFVSGLLFALPLVPGYSEIHLSTALESRQYVHMTVDVMRHFGVETEEVDSVYFIEGGQEYAPTEYTVEADYSQAAVFLSAAALGMDVKCAGLDKDSRQGDSGILSVLEEMGSSIVWDDGIISVNAGKLSSLTFDAAENPDLVPPIAVLCCFSEGTSRIINAGRLRMKESDRLHALAAELNKLGADIHEEADSLIIHGKPALEGGEVDAHNDHRIAMAMALASIRCRGQVKLSGWNSVRKSYPAFWDDFEKIEL